MRQRLLMAILVTLTLVAQSDAGIFRRSPKPDAATYVPALIDLLKSSDDERARASAANALREFDAKAFPEILPVLIDALATDRSASVRAEAAESIGRIRPVTAQAGYALEQAKENDSSTRVRIAARTALVQYRILGMFTGVKSDVAMQSAEPPLAPSTGGKSVPSTTVLRPTPSPAEVNGPVAPPAAPKSLVPSTPPGPQVLGPKVSPETAEPPVADPAKRGPALVAQPKKPAPVITIPTSPVRESTIPVPTVPKPQPAVLPAPKDLPVDLGKPSDKPPAKLNEEGPTLGPPPGK